ncbi:MAG: nitroreductase [Clostridiales bacterium]|nr:nitroreductase [Clostridiales bacterium]
MDIFEAVRTRRSTRVFEKKEIESEKLDAIIEAGRFAPSGGNSQTTHFIVIRSEKILAELAEIVAREFAEMNVEEGMYRSLVASITASKKGHYVFHYNAPVLIVTANKANYGNNIADCACALENMMLAANALDLGSCWINQLKWLNRNGRVVAYLQTLGLEEDEIVCGGLSVGYPKSKDGLPCREPLKRTGNPVTVVD